MPGGNRLLNWPTALTSTPVAVNGTAIDDDHLTLSRHRIGGAAHLLRRLQTRYPPFVIGGAMGQIAAVTLRNHPGRRTG